MFDLSPLKEADPLLLVLIGGGITYTAVLIVMILFQLIALLFRK